MIYFWHEESIILECDVICLGNKSIETIKQEDLAFAYRLVPIQFN